MGGRKPPGVSFETWVDRQIREGLAKGAFDDLPRVRLDLSDAHDEDWWLKRKIRDEGLEVLPPSLVLRREIDKAVADARTAPTEDQARQRIEAVNQRIRDANRIAIAGPPVTLVPYDVDELLAIWRRTHPAEPSDPSTATPGQGTNAVGSRPRRLATLRWRRRRAVASPEPRHPDREVR